MLIILSTDLFDFLSFWIENFLKYFVYKYCLNNMDIFINLR